MHLFEFFFQGVQKLYVTFIIMGRVAAGPRCVPGGPKTCRQASIRDALLSPCQHVRDVPDPARSCPWEHRYLALIQIQTASSWSWWLAAVTLTLVLRCKLGFMDQSWPAYALLFGVCLLGIILNLKPGFVAPCLPLGAAWWLASKCMSSQ